MIRRLLALALAAPPAAAQCIDGRIDAPDASDHYAFGYALDARDGQLVVGDPHVGGGRVHAFSRGPSGYVHRQALERPAGVGASDQFGWSVALDGSTLVVGAPHAGARGEAAVYELGANGWTQVATLAPPPGWVGVRFGHDVAVSGDLVVVGHLASLDGVSVFRRSAGAWSFEAGLLSSDTWSPSGFGVAVAVDAGRVLVGAPTMYFWAGQAYLFERLNGTWLQTQRFFDVEPDPQRRGQAVALRGNLAVIGAPSDSEPGIGQGPGAVHVLRRSAGTWTVQATILASDGALVGGGLPWGYDSFGWAVATDGERVVASAPILGPTGNLYVLTREQGSWAERRRLGPPTGFGVSAIGIDGDDAFLSFAGFMLGPGAVWTVDLLHPAGALVVCDALPNSTGATGRLHYRCSISLERNDLRLRAVDLPPGELAVFFYGALPRHVPFADGFLCIGSPQFRLPPAQVSASGVAQSVVDVLAPPMNAGPGKITAGSTWHFQCWYRDPGGASGTNLTDALRITFCP